MISEEKNAREALCSSQAEGLPALMWHVIRQAVTPGPGAPSADSSSPREGARGTPVTFASQSCLRLSPRLAFDCECNNRLRGRRGGAVDLGGCSYLQGWEQGVCRAPCKTSAPLLLRRAAPQGHSPRAEGSSTAHKCPRGPQPTAGSFLGRDPPWWICWCCLRSLPITFMARGAPPSPDLLQADSSCQLKIGAVRFSFQLTPPFPISNRTGHARPDFAEEAGFQMLQQLGFHGLSYSGAQRSPRAPCPAPGRQHSCFQPGEAAAQALCLPRPETQ